MNRQLSIYLDLLRFLAALTVFVSHVPHFSGGWLWQLSGRGHEAVVFFFVLSGFVIAYVVYEKQEKLEEYALNRLSRIYSVALPALVLAIVLYYAGHIVNQASYQQLDERLLNPFVTAAAALFFLNQSWLDIPTFSNLPYWSLAYEVSYYLFFAILVYSSGKKRYFLLLLIAAIMGPSILLYLPIWLLGVVCFKYLIKCSVSKPVSLALLALSSFGIGVFCNRSVRHTLDHAIESIMGGGFYDTLLQNAVHFGSDYVLAMFVAVHIFASCAVLQNYQIFGSAAGRRIRLCASHTFSLYLYHMPMLFFIAAIFPYETQPVLNLIFCWLFVPCAVLLLSRYTERRKNLYKELFIRLFASVSSRNAIGA